MIYLRMIYETMFLRWFFHEFQCTHIMIDEHPSPINSVIISKPTWMWGAKMGANDKNVVIGTESVPTRYNMEDGDGRVKRLLGMDLVRYVK